LAERRELSLFLEQFPVLSAAPLLKLNGTLLSLSTNSKLLNKLGGRDLSQYLEQQDLSLDPLLRLYGINNSWLL
jgi:hypothetical protein